MKHGRYLSCAVTAMVIFLTVVLSLAQAGEKAGPIKIGALLEYTGAAAGIGGLLEEGVRQRLEEAGWKAAGRDIELLTEDTASAVNVSTDKARKLAEVDKVDVVFGPLVSDSGFAVAGLLGRVGIPNIAFLDHEKRILEHSTIVVPYGTLEGHAVGLGRYAAEKLGHKKVTIVYPDYVGGQLTAKSFETGFVEKGDTVEMVPYPYDTIDFSPMITAISAKKPSAVGFLGEPTHFLHFISQYHKLGMGGVPMLLMWGESLEPVAHELGDLVVGKVGSVYWTSSIDTDISKRFVANFAATHDGRPPIGFELAGYITTSVFLEAVKATGGDTTPERLIGALKGLKIDTPKGPIHISPERQGTDTMYVVKVAKEGDQYIWNVVDSYLSP